MNCLKTKIKKSENIDEILFEVERRKTQKIIDDILTKKINNIELSKKEQYYASLLIDNDDYPI